MVPSTFRLDVLFFDRSSHLAGWLGWLPRGSDNLDGAFTVDFARVQKLDLEICLASLLSERLFEFKSSRFPAYTFNFSYKNG
jgi:hypothetical protein